MRKKRPNLEARRKRKKRFLIATTIIVVGIVCASPFIKKTILSLRHSSALEKYAEYSGKDEPQLAEEQLRYAWLSSDGSLSTQYDLLELAIESQSPNRSLMADAVLKHDADSLNESHYATALRAYLDSKDLEKFASVEASIPESIRQSTRIKELFGRFHLLSGNRSRALDEIGQLDVLDTEGESDLKLQLLASSHNNPFAQKEAAKLIRDGLLTSDPKRRLKTIRLINLLKSPIRHFEGQEILTALEGTDDASVDDFLFAYSLSLESAKADERDQIIKTVIQRFQESDSKELAAWLISQQKSDSLEEIESTSDNDSLYLADIQKLLNEERFEDCWQNLQSPPAKMNQMILEGLKAGVAFRLKRLSVSIFHRDRALQAASQSGSYAAIRSLLTIFEKLGDTPSAKKTADIISKISPSRLPSARSLTYLDEYFEDDSRELLSFYEGLYAARPNDLFTAYKYSLLIIASGQETDRAKRIIFPLVKKNPNNLRLASVLALASLTDNTSIEDAFDHLPQTHPGWQNSPSAPDRAILSTALFLNGRIEEANQLNQLISSKDIPPFLLTYLRTLWPSVAQ